MAYTKNYDPWASGYLVTPLIMDNFETIYTEISGYLSSHVHDDLYQTQAEMQAAYWYSGNCGSESGADADFLYMSTGNLHAASFAGLGVPTGLITLWYGSVASIPAGWQLANGTGTIGMMGKFPVGAGTGSAYSVGDTGGAYTFTAAGTITVTSHALTTAEIASHHHPYTETKNSSVYNPNSGSIRAIPHEGGGTTASAGSGDAHGHSAAEGTSFTGNAVASLPFCIALCYIQKI